MQEDADPGEVPMSSIEHPKFKPPRQDEGDALDSNGTNAKHRRAEASGAKVSEPSITIERPVWTS